MGSNLATALSTTTLQKLLTLSPNGVIGCEVGGKEYTVRHTGLHVHGHAVLAGVWLWVSEIFPYGLRWLGKNVTLFFTMVCVAIC